LINGDHGKSIRMGELARMRILAHQRPLPMPFPRKRVNLRGNNVKFEGGPYP
jgi:hypothetical protein